VSAAAVPGTQAHANGTRRREAHVPVWALTAALGAVYLIIAPQSPDLAAASYRSFLFTHHGFTLWDNAWYGGHNLAAYSLLAPALGALLTPRVLAALSMTIATALFARVTLEHFPARAARLGALWFALGASISLLSSRVPFDLGLAIGLGSVALAQRRALGSSLAAALLTSVASPVAGAFLALAFISWALAERARRAPALVLACAALLPIALLALAFPEGGTQPFVASAFYPTLAAVGALLALMPREQRVLRTGTLLYALALVAAYVLPTAVGGNADRLGALAAGPLAACALAAGAGARRRLALALLAPALLYWQVNAPLTDFVAAETSAAVSQSYYDPLLRELRALRVGGSENPARIEVVPTAAHWEARFLAPRVMLARGWERQLDRYRNPLFYDEGSATQLAAGSYAAWLAQQGISYVALPDAPIDYSGRAEARLVRSGRASESLREVWRSRHWRLFAVLRPTPLATGAARLAEAGNDWFALSVPRAGSYTVLIHFSSYWQLANGHGCVSRSPRGDWTQVQARVRGSLRVSYVFSLARVLSTGRRCR
jgi:hypothetical protein